MPYSVEPFGLCEVRCVLLAPDPEAGHNGLGEPPCLPRQLRNTLANGRQDAVHDLFIESGSFARGLPGGIDSPDKLGLPPIEGQYFVWLAPIAPGYGARRAPAQ